MCVQVSVRPDAYACVRAGYVCARMCRVCLACVGVVVVYCSRVQCVNMKIGSPP